jgi:hypothetical protein
MATASVYVGTVKFQLTQPRREDSDADIWEGM